MVDKTFCVGCGKPTTEDSCESCQTPNLYRDQEPLECARKRLARLAMGALFDTKFETFAPPHGGGTGRSGALSDMETGVAPDFGDQTERIVAEEDGGDESTERIDASYRAKLIRLEPEGEPREIRLVPGRYVVGRPGKSTGPGGKTADILIHHRSVSRRHAEVCCSIDENGDPQITVCDLGSANGTILNNRHVGAEPAEMSWDDEIVLGEVRYQLRIQQKY